MHVALTIEEDKDDQLIFAQQLGVDHVLVAVESWESDRLAALRNRVEKSGLQLVGVAGLTVPSGGDEGVTAARCAIVNAGAAGIALVRCRCLAESSAVAWDSLATFLSGVLPVAEKAGVHLACCPHGLTPGSQDLQRLRTMASSPYYGLDLCTGTLAGVPRAELAGMVEAREQAGGLLMVHLGSRRAGDDPDVPRALSALQDVGFGGPVETGPPLPLSDDTEWAHTARSLDVGYVAAVLQTLGSW